jgi:hypothetical protein
MCWHRSGSPPGTSWNTSISFPVVHCNNHCREPAVYATGLELWYLTLNILQSLLPNPLDFTYLISWPQRGTCQNPSISFACIDELFLRGFWCVEAVLCWQVYANTSYLAICILFSRKNRLCASWSVPFSPHPDFTLHPWLEGNYLLCSYTSDSPFGWI